MDTLPATTADGARAHHPQDQAWVFPLPSELSPASPTGTDCLFIGPFWVDSLPPSTVLGPKGHGHPVLPLQQMSQGDWVGWFNSVYHAEGMHRK